jgi:hypothetical protein
MSGAFTTEPIDNLRQRKQSVGAFQIATENGTTRTVQLDELSDADRELAEKFGYNPVSIAKLFSYIRLNNPK